MADPLHHFETLEHRYMRAWIQRDLRTLKELTSRSFRLLFATSPATILDARSWTDAATGRLRCEGYRFGQDIFARKNGSTAIFAARIELECKMDGVDWSGSFFITDVWRKSKLRRRWQLTERLLSRPDAGTVAPEAIRALQQWR